MDYYEDYQSSEEYAFERNFERAVEERGYIHKDEVQVDYIPRSHFEYEVQELVEALYGDGSVSSIEDSVEYLCELAKIPFKRKGVRLQKCEPVEKDYATNLKEFLRGII